MTRALIGMASVWMVTLSLPLPGLPDVPAAQCSIPWFFTRPRLPDCPLNPPLESDAAFQNFKYGYMIWVGAQDVIDGDLKSTVVFKADNGEMNLRSGQINGLIGGLRGAAEYESLIGRKGKAVAGMDAQSATHLAIIVLVLICNLFYLSLRRTARRPSGVNASIYTSNGYAIRRSDLETWKRSSGRMARRLGSTQYTSAASRLSDIGKTPIE